MGPGELTMLRFIGILVTALYMTVTSGIVINIHYCMDEPSAVALGPGGASTCSNCGMDNDGCCHDDVQVVKLAENHHGAPVFSGFIKMITEVSKHDEADLQDEIPAKWVGAAKAHTPPKVFDRNIHYRVFRI
jgi:hypothetical protein